MGSQSQGRRRTSRRTALLDAVIASDDDVDVDAVDRPDGDRRIFHRQIFGDLAGGTLVSALDNRLRIVEGLGVAGLYHIETTLTQNVGQSRGGTRGARTVLHPHVNRRRIEAVAVAGDYVLAHHRLSRSILCEEHRLAVDPADVGG